MGLNMAQLSELSREALEAMVAKYQASAKRRVTLKVTEKGGVSLYGLGRFPVTLYKSQWMRLLDEVDAIREFIVANDALLATKD